MTNSKIKIYTLLNNKVRPENRWILLKGVNFMEKLVYSIQEVAELLGISRSYAYELAKEKKIPVLDLGRRKVIPKESLETWIAENVNI